MATTIYLKSVALILLKKKKIGNKSFHSLGLQTKPKKKVSDNKQRQDKLFSYKHAPFNDNDQTQTSLVIVHFCCQFIIIIKMFQIFFLFS